MVAIGTTLLWFGWYGFNAGSELNVDSITVAAFLNTDIAASFAAITWLIIEWNTGDKKPTFIGLMTGAVAGLATITPAAGFVTLPVAAIIGVVAAVGCYLAVHLKDKLGWDDALDVWGVHGMGGVIGTICLGLFATKIINPGAPDGLFYGGGLGLLWKEFVAVVLASVWAFMFTIFMMRVINKFTPVKVSISEEDLGLDMAFHGEVARQE